MKDKLKNLIIVAVFFVVIFGIFVLNAFKEDKKVSISERRKLLQMPKFSIATFYNGSFQDKFENYLKDQITFREFFKNVNFNFKENVLKNKDTNGYFVKDDVIFKLGKTNKYNIDKTISNLNEIINLYMKDNKIYASIIPDKNYYLEDNTYLNLDVEYMEDNIKNKMNVSYIDIKDKINLNSFYSADIHLKQECTIDLVYTLLNSMGKESININDFKVSKIGEFEGSYYYNTYKKLKKDTLNILSNETLDNLNAYNFEKNVYEPVYNFEKYNTSIDKYDVFLSGPTSIQKIENKNAKEDNNLIVFRDSFGSELVPLMLQNYHYVTLIDLRYVSPKILDNYVDFTNADVLFIYSAEVVNQNILKSLN